MEEHWKTVYVRPARLYRTFSISEGFYKPLSVFGFGSVWVFRVQTIRFHLRTCIKVIRMLSQKKVIKIKWKEKGFQTFFIHSSFFSELNLFFWVRAKVVVRPLNLPGLLTFSPYQVPDRKDMSLVSFLYRESSSRSHKDRRLLCNLCVCRRVAISSLTVYRMCQITTVLFPRPLLNLKFSR